MSDARWERLEALFEAACALPASERDAFLKRECGDDLELREEVRSLLAADRSGNRLLDGSALDLAHTLTAPLAPGRQVGPYRVSSELGEGGMGAVYLAERCDGQFEQRVALKIVRFGLASPALVRRFAEERQILARLEHPGIARLLDGGVTEEGLPWFSMEYVEGEPIDRWCDQRDLDVRARLELFAAVCDAVQYAQNNLVVHRDLKPSNILVTGDGVVKLLDFGIAKLVETNPEADDRSLRTRTAAPMMTASYAAPEQVLGGRITTATDVYALGMVLYELLAGSRAYEVTGLTPTQLERAVCVDTPARPSSTLSDSRRRRQVAGDLDNICLKALAKEPERRYATAGQLVEDIRLHLAGLPVSARPATFGYLARKAIRRYRPQLTIAAAALVVLIVLGVWSAHRITHERDLARREAARTTQVAKFLTSLFRVSDPEEARGKDVSARELLQRGAARVNTELAGQPDLQATMDGVLGNVYLNLGLHDESDSLLTRAVSLNQKLDATEGPEYGEQLSNLGQLRVEQGRYADADSVLSAALAIQRRNRRPDDTRISSTLVSLGHVKDLTGDYERAEALYREAITVCKSSPKPDDLRLSTAMGALALELLDRDRLDESEKLFRETLALQRRTLGNDHPEVATTLFNLGLLLSNRGDYAGAEKLQRETMALDRKLYGDEHPNVAYDLNNLSFLERQKGNFAQAESLAHEAVAMRRKLLGADHPQTIESEANLAQVLQARGEYAEAARLAREVLEEKTRIFGSDSPALCAPLNQYGWFLYDLGRFATADSLHRRSLALGIATLGPDHKSVAISRLQLARDLVGERQLAEADSVLQPGMAAARRLYGDDNIFTAAFHMEQGRIRLEQGRLDEALDEVRTAMAIADSADSTNPRNAGARLVMAEIEHEQGRLAAADSLYRDATRIRELTVPASHPEAAWIRLRHGALLLEEGEVAAAATLIEPAADSLAKALPSDHWRVAYARMLEAVCHLAANDPGARAEFDAERERVVADLGADSRLVKELDRVAE